MVNWPGREGMTEFDARVDGKCLSARGIAHIKGMAVKGRGGKDMIVVDVFRKYEPILLNDQWRHFMPTQVEMLTELTDEVRAALKQYEGVVTAFRGATKNDISSAKAAATAIEENLLRMKKVYTDTANMLGSVEFERAIENAERMASALKAISELKSNSITFAVLDKTEHR